MDSNTKEKGYAQNQAGTERTLVNYRPVLFCAFFFAGGILSCKLIYDDVSAWWMLLLALLPCSIFLYPKCSRKIACIRIGALLLSFFIGIGSYALQIKNYESGGRYNGKYLVCGRVVECLPFDNLCRVVLTDVEVDGNREKGKLIAYLPYMYYEEITLCDEVAVYGKVTREGLDRMEEGYAYTVESNVRFQVNGEGATVIGYTFRLFPYLRQCVQDVLFSCMDETAASVSFAILTGDVSFMDSGLLENVRRGGIAHIFAVSGLHVGALFAFTLALMKMKALKRMPKWLRLTLVASILLFYGGICGYSSSVVRAIVMCLVIYASLLAGLITDTGETLGVSAIVVLLLAPMSLFTVGFQLSFAACFGIAWLSRPMRNAWIKPIPVSEDGDTMPLTFWQACKRKMLSFFAVTLSAQIATLPIQLTAFGYVSCWSILTNFLFVPLISAAFSVFLFLVAIACFFSMSWASVLLYVPNVLWAALLLVFETIDFSWPAITNIRLGMGGIALYYILCSYFTDKWKLGKRAKSLLIFTTSLALILTVVLNSIIAI